MCHDFFQKNPGKVVTKFNFNFLFSKDPWCLPIESLVISVLPCGSTVSSNDDPSHVVASSDENMPTFNRTNEDIEENLCNNELDGNALEMENLVDNAVFHSEQEECFKSGLKKVTIFVLILTAVVGWKPEVSLLNEEATFSDIEPSRSTAELTTEGKDLEFELNSPSQGATPDTRA